MASAGQYCSVVLKFIVHGLLCFAFVRSCAAPAAALWSARVASTCFSRLYTVDFYSCTSNVRNYYIFLLRFRRGLRFFKGDYQGDCTITRQDTRTGMKLQIYSDHCYDSCATGGRCRTVGLRSCGLVLCPLPNMHVHRLCPQIVLRWGVQRGTAIIPKTSKPERMTENISLFDFELTQVCSSKSDDLLCFRIR